MQPRSDKELMLCVKHGQLQMLGELFERHHVKLFNFFLRFCGDRHWSEDMVQTTFYKILNYAYTYEDRGEFPAWMFNIARNVALDHMNNEKRAAYVDDSGLDGIEAPASNPEFLETMQQEERRLQQALLKLPTEKRQLILLSKVSQISLTDLAAMYDCSVSAIKVRVHRALELLRAHCEQDLDLPDTTCREKII